MKLRFQRFQRLLSAKEFTPVFNEPTHKLSDRSFLLLARPSCTSAPARLGLVVAKKNLKRAVDRNRFKRLVRQRFRLMQHELNGLDIVVLARRGAEQTIYSELDDRLVRQFSKLAAYHQRTLTSMS